MNDKTLIFLHLPKTAGNTLLEFMLPNYDGQPIFDVYARPKPNEQAHVRHYAERLEELAETPESFRRSLTLVYGHLPYGVHSLLPQPSHYLTYVREPVARVASLYQFIHENPRHYLYEPIVTKKLSLSDFATSDLAAEISNCMTRMLCGDPDSDAIRGHAPCPADALDRAWAHVQASFAVAAPVEQFDRSLYLLHHVLGWPLRSIPIRNVTRSRQTSSALADDERTVIAQANALDVELYRRICQRFDQQCGDANIPVAPPSLVCSIQSPSQRQHATFVSRATSYLRRAIRKTFG